jgi:polyisoprenoid-binding protein YceI
MRLTSLALAALIWLPLTAPAPAEPYLVDKSHAFVTFTADHFGFSIVHGLFRDFDAEIDFDPSNVEATRVRFSIETASVETYSAARDDQLRSPAFFASDKYPQMAFISTAVQSTGTDTAEITGMLTIREVTNEIKLQARLNQIGPSPFFPDITVAGFTVTGVIDRTKWGMTFGAPAIGAKIPIQIDLEMSPRD